MKNGFRFVLQRGECSFFLSAIASSLSTLPHRANDKPNPRRLALPRVLSETLIILPVEFDSRLTAFHSPTGVLKDVECRDTCLD